MFWCAWCKKLYFEFWPLIRGQRLLKMTSKRLKWKTEVIFEFPTPRNLCFDMRDAKNSFLNFDLWWEVRGHCRWPLRGQNKKLRSFLSSPPQRTYVLICMMQKTLFWILTSDERSEVIVGDLWEVKMKNQGQIWVSHPKEPMFWYTWCKKLFFGFWPQMRGQRSFKWPLRGQIDWKSIFYPYFWLACSNRKK